MKARLLIVDDELEIREMLSRRFRIMGYEVATAVDGADAMDTLENQMMDIVISDINMPRMDGIELLRRIRAEFPMIHTIMITGVVTQENILACMRHGADTCVFKPLPDSSELDRSVEAAVVSIARWKQKLLDLRHIEEKIGD